MKNNYLHHPTFIQYKKKSHQFISSLQYEKIITKEKKKKFKRKKHKIKNILKGKKIKGKEISCQYIRRCSVMHYLWCYCRKYFI